MVVSNKLKYFPARPYNSKRLRADLRTNRYRLRPIGRLMLVLALMISTVGLVPSASANAAPAQTRAVTTSDANTVDPLTCAGYPQPRQFVEAQSWWTRTAGKSGDDFGHVHVGACIPERENLTENQTLDIRLLLHNNPGRVAYISLIFKGTDYETKVWQSPGGQVCPNPGTCTWWFRAPVDINQFGHSGLQEIRFRAFVDEPDEQRMTASLNFQTYIWNGKSRSDVTRRPYLRGKGWYTGSEYCEVAFKEVPIPDTPVSDVWSPLLGIVWHGTPADLPVTHHSVRLDPDAHNGIPGTILKNGPGEFQGDVSVDTTVLPNGRHRLVGRADCDDPRGSTNSGVLLINFRSSGLDTVKPVVRAPTARFLTNTTLGASSVPVRQSWSSSDDLSGISQHQLQRSINGGTYTNVSLPAPTATSITSPLTIGNDYRFRVRAQDRAGNWSDWKYGVTFRVLASQETHNAISYGNGTWKRATLSSASGGYVKYSTASAATANFTFSGRSLAWAAPKSAGRGRAEIYINGVYAKTVDLYSATALARRIVYSQTWATSDTRTLKVRLLGTPTRPRVDIDAFVVLR